MARRDWVASRGELIKLGIDQPAIDTWLETRRLVPILHGIYAYGRDIESRRSAWRAALLAAGDGAILSGVSACQLWNMTRDTRAIPTSIEVASGERARTIFRGRSPALNRTTVRVVHRDLEPGEIRTSGGLKVASPPRALLDFAVAADEVALKFAFLEACRLGHFVRGDVHRSMIRMVGRRGASKLRPLVSRWVPELSEIRSPTEGFFVLAWVPTGRPMPKVNARVCGYEVDLLWIEQRVIVELDGVGYHGDPISRSRDAGKQRDLERAGFRVIRFGSDQVFPSLDAVIAEVIRALDGVEISKVTDSR